MTCTTWLTGTGRKMPKIDQSGVQREKTMSWSGLMVMVGYARNLYITGYKNAHQY